ncbi:hypothetical protein N7G274_000475 [Stereocaulon virgatum]|uniref:Uncharacterized protein n=1 Tax=Stereocaulon virgatum TaxID=373712 RepID=A0ABR4AYJ8_9LECA
MRNRPMVIFYRRPLQKSRKFAEPRSLALWWAKSAQKYVFRSIYTAPPRCRDPPQNARRLHPKCWSLLSSSSSAISSAVSSRKVLTSATDPSKVPLLVVLVTPTHLTLLEDSNAFIPNLLRQEVGTPPPGQVVNVMAAVVDQLPHPQCTVDGQSNSSDAVLEYSGQDGSEGVSVAVLTSCSAAPDLWLFRQESEGRESMTVQQRCTLSFAFPSINSTSSHGQRPSNPLRASQVLQLPVANTMFQNGNTSTLLAQQWVLRRENASKAKFFLTKKKRLPQQTLNMDDLLAEKVFLHQCMRFNLTQITPARVITAAIGNIIRRIRVCDSSKENTPASEELEGAISGEIAKGRISAQPAGIWALIKPRDQTTSDENSCLDLTYGHDLLENAILSGCRLHKVLSGGGGWGEKRGLLALDPESNYLWRSHEFQSDFTDDKDAEFEKVQALGEVVRPGDMVTFYVSNTHSAPGSAVCTQSDLVNSSLSTSLSLMFGSLPSTMDAMPNTTGTGEAGSEQSSCVMIHNHFGILSEHGMSLKSTFIDSHVKCVETKLDAPYTLCTIRGTARSSECNEASGSSSEAPQTETQQSRIKERLDGGLPTTNTSPDYQGAWKGCPRDISMRWTQNTAPRPPNIDIRQGRPFTTDLRSYSRSYSRLKPDNAPHFGKKEQCKFNDQANMGRVSAKGLFGSLDRPGLIRNSAKEVVRPINLKQQPLICTITVPEPLVPRSRASIEESAVPEASVRVRTCGPKDEKEMSTNMQVPTQVREQGLLEGERASRDRRPGKEQAPDEEQASEAQTLPPIEEETTKPSIQTLEAEHATKAKFEISDEEKDLEALVKAQTVDAFLRKGNEPHMPSRLKARKVAHLEKSATHVLDQEAKTQDIWIAEAKKDFGRFRFVTEVPKKEQSGGPYPKSGVIRKHLSVRDSSKPRLDQVPETRRLGNRLDAAPYSIPSPLEKTWKGKKDIEYRKKEKEKWTDKFKSGGNVYQINLKLSARERSKAREEPKLSAEDHSDNPRHLRHLYQHASHHPAHCPITPAGSNVAKFEVGHELLVNGYSTKKHLSEAPSSRRTQPASSRDGAQDLHKHRLHLSPDEIP